jgi:hypothetical protein
MRAECCFCGDKSYIQDVKGGFHIAGFGGHNEQYPTPSTNFSTFDTDAEGVITCTTTKATKDATPIRI